MSGNIRQHGKLYRADSGTPAFNGFWKMSSRKLSTNLSPKELREAFEKYDVDGDGEITIAEAHRILKNELGFDPHKTRQMVKSCDENGDGVLQFDEFVKFYSKVKAKLVELRSMFDEFDRDGSGFISLDEAKVIMRNLAFNEEEIETLVHVYDADGNGRLDYPEFVKLWNAS